MVNSAAAFNYTHISITLSLACYVMFYITTGVTNVEDGSDGGIQCIWYNGTLELSDLVELPPPAKATLYMGDTAVDIGKPQVMGHFPDAGTTPDYVTTGDYAIKGKFEHVNDKIVVTDVTAFRHCPVSG